MVSLGGFHCESSTSLASEISESHTHSQKHSHRHTHTGTQSLQHTNLQLTNTYTFISSRQLAMEYMTRLRRDLHSLRDTKNRERRRQDKRVYFLKRVTSYFHPSCFFFGPSNVTLSSINCSYPSIPLIKPPLPAPHQGLF